MLYLIFELLYYSLIPAFPTTPWLQSQYCERSQLTMQPSQREVLHTVSSSSIKMKVQVHSSRWLKRPSLAFGGRQPTRRSGVRSWADGAVAMWLLIFFIFILFMTLMWHCCRWRMQQATQSARQAVSEPPTSCSWRQQLASLHRMACHCHWQGAVARCHWSKRAVPPYGAQLWQRRQPAPRLNKLPLICCQLQTVVCMALACSNMLTHTHTLVHSVMCMCASGLPCNFILFASPFQVRRMRRHTKWTLCVGGAKTTSNEHNECMCEREREGEWHVREL